MGYGYRKKLPFCKMCGKKNPINRRVYCCNACRLKDGKLKMLMYSLIKEIYRISSNDKIFTDEDIINMLKDKETIEKFKVILDIKNVD